VLCSFEHRPVITVYSSGVIVLICLGYTQNVTASSIVYYWFLVQLLVAETFRVDLALVSVFLFGQRSLRCIYVAESYHFILNQSSKP
jgi:hypothetical protein